MTGEDEAHGRFLATRTFCSLDGLRGLSILGVLWHHTMPGWARFPITQRGFLGVDLFFILSGFLITTLLLRERRRTGTISLRGFYFRRFLRIFPAYYALLAILAVVSLAGTGTVSRALRHDLPFAVAYVSNLVPMQGLLSITWSLSAEEQFYLAAPALQRWLPRVVPTLVLPLAYLATALPPFGLFPHVGLPAFFRQTTFGPILLGVGLAHALDAPAGFRFVARVVGVRFAAPAALGLVVVACCQPSPDISGWPRLLIHLSLVILLASCVVREDHGLSPLLGAWPLRRLGAVSYGVYLYHLVVYAGVDRALRFLGHESSWLLFAGVGVCSWGVAELSYRLYERRFLALKVRLSSAAPAVPGAYTSGSG